MHNLNGGWERVWGEEMRGTLLDKWEKNTRWVEQSWTVNVHMACFEKGHSNKRAFYKIGR